MGVFEPKHRPDTVQHRIGSVLTHRFFGRGVAYGWDPLCAADEAWCMQNQIDQVLRKGRNQPFYNLLLSDGTSRYCSQENLQVDHKPSPVTHPMVDFYFDCFNGDSGSNQPNGPLTQRYPDG